MQLNPPFGQLLKVLEQSLQQALKNCRFPFLPPSWLPYRIFFYLAISRSISDLLIYAEKQNYYSKEVTFESSYVNRI